MVGKYFDTHPNASEMVGNEHMLPTLPSLSLKAAPVPSGFFGFGFGLSFVAAPVGLAQALGLMVEKI